MQAKDIGIDAPYRWSANGRARPAERQLISEGIWCFSSPTRQMAIDHPRNHFGWMLNSEDACWLTTHLNIVTIGWTHDTF